MALITCFWHNSGEQPIPVADEFLRAVSFCGRLISARSQFLRPVDFCGRSISASGRFLRAVGSLILLCRKQIPDRGQEKRVKSQTKVYDNGPRAYSDIFGRLDALTGQNENVKETL